ncbi:lymphocyte antigen 6H-like [Notamacropus eugenii]|uniref:lymphocyte antigen 6H-like n=1 Tax=Notamacropus eugenii TaxID=9315 RepID=UPI003B678554
MASPEPAEPQGAQGAQDHEGKNRGGSVLDLLKPVARNQGGISRRQTLNCAGAKPCAERLIRSDRTVLQAENVRNHVGPPPCPAEHPSLYISSSSNEREFLSTAHSLHCYNCTGVKKTSQCQPVLCSKFATRCGSLKAGDQDGPDHKRLHFKGCADVSCEGFFKELWDKAYIEIPASLMVLDYTCCSKELCNGTDGIKGSPLVLIGAFLLSFGPAFLWVML